MRQGLLKPAFNSGKSHRLILQYQKCLTEKKVINYNINGHITTILKNAIVEMSKIVNIILTIAIITCMVILLVYGYYSIQKLDKSKEAEVVSTIGKHINDRDKALLDSESIHSDEDDGIVENENFEEYIEDVEEELHEEIPEAVTPVPSLSINKPASAYMIIAGSYKSQSNAKNKVKQLSDLGISAEIVHMNNSKLHAICIARSSTEKEANDTKSMLKTKYNIKTYVYKVP